MKKYFSTSLFLLIIAVSFSQNLFEKGINAYNNGDYKSAVEYYSKLLKTNRSSNVYFNRSLAYYFLEEYNSAIEDCTIALNEDPNDFETWYYRGMSYYKIGDYTKAISDAEKSLKLNPNYLQNYTTIGLSYSKLEEYQKAISSFNKALSEKENSLLYYNKALVYQKLEMFTEAQNNFSKAIKLEENVKYFWSRADLYYTNKYYKKAIDDYNIAIKLDSTISALFFNKGLSYYANYQNKLALNSFYKSLQLDTNHIESKWYIALANYELGNYELALDYYNKVEKQNPNFSELNKINKTELVKKTNLGDYLWYIVALIVLIVVASLLVSKIYFKNK